ncbi:MAG: T9SS type A sorting domain-containing protein [Balneolaceae bacterium]
MKQVLPIKKINNLGCIFFALLMLSNPVELVAQQLAFPGADGFGKYTTGGRGGDVYEVTNLNNSGPGSLRAGVEAEGARTIIFRISGTIHLTSELRIRNDNISIFGQTAPGDGIATKGEMVVIDADNVIIQYMRFRPGNLSGGEPDALWGREQKDIILDHISMSWAIDETGSFYDNENFTLQWSILSESLYESDHEKGRHGYGGIWGGMGASFHHNLLAHHSSRNPRFNGSRYSGNAEAELVDFRNNVIYNWGNNSSYAAEGGSYNLVNNYFKPGPATSSNRDRIIQPWPDNGSNSQPAGVHGLFYIDGNYVYGSEEVTADNWEGVDPSNSFDNYGISKEDLVAAEPFEVEDIASFETAEEAFVSVLANAGAILPRRDTLDSRIVHETETGTATYGGSYGEGEGIIDSQEEVGGWPELMSAPAPEDTDGDGIPDEWETENSLDPNDSTDGKELAESGYSNLEEYIHTLQEQSGEFSPVPGSLALNFPVQESDVSLQPEFSWNAATYASAYEMEIRDGAGDYGEIIFAATAEGTSLTLEEELEGGETYFWRVRGVNDEGAGVWTDYEYFVTETPTSIESPDGVPNTFTLGQNYPNPFNPTTNIRYGLPHSADIDLRVFDMTGREVARRIFKNQSAGFHTVEFDFSSQASGVYIYKLKGISTSIPGDQVFSQTRKMTLIK